MARIRPRTQVRSGPSTVNGSGESPILSSGAPKAQVSLADGSGTRIVTSSGTPQAQDASIAGTALTAFVVAYGPASFSDGAGNQTYDLSAQIASAMPSGHVATGLSVHADSPGALPAGATLDLANQQIVFTDADGGVQGAREVWIEVQHAAEQIASFTLVEA